jgi:phosphate/sulfate permease
MREIILQFISKVDWWAVLTVVGSTIFGAVISFIPAYFLSRKASKEVLERDRVARAEKQNLATMRALVKFQTISNGTGTVHHQLEEMIARGGRLRHWGR